MYALNIVPYIEHYTGKNVKYQGETNCKKRRIDKKQPYFSDRYIKLFAKVSTNAK